MPNVIVVGAGISGLSLAYRLEQASPLIDVTVLEQANRPGGKVWTERFDDYRIELGANGFLDTKPSTLALCRDLGLAEQLIPASEAAGRNRFLAVGDSLRPFPRTFVDFLRSDLLSWKGKLQLLAEPLRPRRRSREDESIRDFVRRRAGPEAADVFADALVTGIYAGDPAVLSLPASFPRLSAFESRYGSVLRGLIRERRDRARANKPATSNLPRNRMWSFREGLRLLIERLAESIGEKLLLGVDVSSVERRPEAGPAPWTVRAAGGRSWTADAVIVTCPAHDQAALLAGVDSTLADLIAGIPYNRVAVVALGYERRAVAGELDGFGFIVPQSTRRDLLGVQWCSSIFPDRAPAGSVLFRAMCGGWNRAEMVGWDDARLLLAVRRELERVMGITAPPRFHKIIRWNRAIPQYQLGHVARLDAIERRVAQWPGLFLGGNAYRGVAINDCTEQSAVLAQKVQGYLDTLLCHRPSLAPASG
jgi:protoporphyrinogen/coproporphyrinogen III oxidase